MGGRGWRGSPEGRRRNEKWAINGISADPKVKRHADSEEFQKGTKIKH